jgi:hypothetical protein
MYEHKLYIGYTNISDTDCLTYTDLKGGSVLLILELKM